VLYYWGENGEYGPFSVGDDGFPKSGEVIRYYRSSIHKISAKKFGELYGKALGEQPKTREWVLHMERTSYVPTDITRRRVIVNLLGIPPMLLGLSETLTKTSFAMSYAPKALVRSSKQEDLHKQVFDEYQQSLAQYFEGYYHRHGQAALDAVTEATQQLGTLVADTTTRNQQQGMALISRYHQFGTNIAREQQNYDLAIFHADKAIEYAQNVHATKPNSDLMAIAFFRRGITSFEQTTISLKQDHLNQAVFYLDTALSYAQHATPLMSGLISLEWGLVHAHVAQTEKEKTQVIHQLDAGYKYITQYRAEDDVNFVKFSSGWYHLTRAEVLIALRMYIDGLGELELAEEITPLTLPRRFAYIDALRAKAYSGLGEYEEAAAFAKDALTQSQAVKSRYNIARVAQVCQQLKESSYGQSENIVTLERKLKQLHPNFVHNSFIS